MVLGKRYLSLCFFSSIYFFLWFWEMDTSLHFWETAQLLHQCTSQFFRTISNFYLLTLHRWIFDHELFVYICNMPYSSWMQYSLLKSGRKRNMCIILNSIFFRKMTTTTAKCLVGLQLKQKFSFVNF